MNFRPINDENAIESVTFSLRIDRFVSQSDIQNLAVELIECRDELPAISLTNNDEAFGIELSYKRPDSSSIWSLNMINDLIQISCTRYSRWDKIWARARRYMLACIAAVSKSDESAENKTQFDRLSIQVKDIFAFGDSSDEKPNFALLLNESDYLTRHSLQGSSAWHCNSGWFGGDDENSFLNTLDIASKREQQKINEKMDPSIKWVVSISHYQDNRSEIANNKDLSKNLDKIMKSMHNNNKKVLSEILTKEAQEMVSLWRENDSGQTPE